MNKIFTETDSFFYCETGDITNSLQRLCVAEIEETKSNQYKPMWQRVDDRFFWNKHMLQDIISLKVNTIKIFYFLIIRYTLLTIILSNITFSDEQSRLLDITSHSRIYTNRKMQSRSRIL